MANFTVTNTTAIGGGNAQAAITTTYKTQLLIGNSTTSGATVTGMLRRGKLYDLTLGTAGAPADNYYEYDICRVTMGTSSTLAGNISSLSSNFGVDGSDNGGAIACIGTNSSIETAFSALTEVFYMGVNQRATYRWVANPGSEFVYPAASSATGINGFAIRARSGAGTVSVTTSLLFSE